MKLMKSLISLVIIAAVAIALITMCPTTDEFVEYYVEHHESGVGAFFDEAFETVVEQRTTMDNYLIFSVFTVDGKDKYVGILEHFFGRSSVEKAKDTAANLLDQAKEMLEK